MLQGHNRLVDLLRPYWFRGKGRLFNAMIPHRGEREASIFGYKMRLDLGEFIQRNIYLGTYEPPETAFVKRVLKPGMCFVDVGANVGYFTALAASLVGENGKVVAIEPSPYAADCLQTMVEKNNISQVKILSVGLSSKSGHTSLYFSRDPSSHAPTMISYAEADSKTVPIRTLDEILSELNISSIDLLKIDIEGYELEALKGAARALSERKIKALMCEFNDYWLREMGTSPQILYDTLIRAGFEIISGSPHFPSGCIVTHFFRLAGE